jgi:FKBP-type peptidyl-prolyl cis-trans isomerase
MNDKIAILVVLVVSCGFFYAAWFANNSSSQVAMSKDAALSKLSVVDTNVGTGAEAVPGKMVSVHYTGTLDDGSVFDSSYKRGEPIEFPLGQNFVIQGWELGIQGMKVGGKRKLTIPAELGYGDKEKPGIPANSTLHFDVELVGVK